MEDDDFEFLAELNHFGRMLDALPGHVGDVKESIDAIEVEEDAEIGDIFHDTFTNIAFVDVLKDFSFFGDTLLFQEFSARNDDVFASRY